MGAYGRATTAGPLLDPSVREALAGRHILIAEDNEVNQQVAREMLEQVGMRVTIAENGRRAIEILTAGEAVFDAVLMDLQMPEVNGLTAARAIMSDAAFRDLPIVAITAHAFQDERRQIGRASGRERVCQYV